MCLMLHLGGHQDHAVQHAPAQPTGTATSGGLLGILRRRYALGEITREQFEEMQRVLGLSERKELPRSNPNTHSTRHRESHVRQEV